MVNSTPLHQISGAGNRLHFLLLISIDKSPGMRILSPHCRIIFKMPVRWQTILIKKELNIQ